MDFRQFLESFRAYGLKDIEELIPSTYQDPTTLLVMADMFEEMGEGNYGKVTWKLMDQAFPARMKSGTSGTGQYARTPQEQGTRDDVSLYWKEVPIDPEDPEKFVPYTVTQELHYTPMKGFSYEILPDATSPPATAAAIRAPSNENVDRAIRAIQGARTTWNRPSKFKLPEPEVGPLRVALVLMKIPTGRQAR
jgi:hypothetical protein